MHIIFLDPPENFLKFATACSIQIFCTCMLSRLPEYAMDYHPCHNSVIATTRDEYHNTLFYIFSYIFIFNN